MSEKQGEEDLKMVKNPDQETENYLFQKNAKTKSGATIVVTFLIIIIIAIAVSWYYFKLQE